MQHLLPISLTICTLYAIMLTACSDGTDSGLAAVQLTGGSSQIGAGGSEITGGHMAVGGLSSAGGLSSSGGALPNTGAVSSPGGDGMGGENGDECTDESAPGDEYTCAEQLSGANSQKIGFKATAI